MKIKEMKLKVRDLIEGYAEDDTTSRVVAWGGKLDEWKRFDGCCVC